MENVFFSEHGVVSCIISEKQPDINQNRDFLTDPIGFSPRPLMREERYNAVVHIQPFWAQLTKCD